MANLLRTIFPGGPDAGSIEDGDSIDDDDPIKDGDLIEDDFGSFVSF